MADPEGVQGVRLTELLPHVGLYLCVCVCVCGGGYIPGIFSGWGMG